MPLEMSDPAPLIITEEIPDKLYFRIGEVSRLVGLPQSVLRFWEKQFPALSPKKSGGKHRLYRRKDVELLLELKYLLYEKRLTIEGARRYLASKPNAKRQARQPARSGQAALFETAPFTLDEVRKELKAILELLR